MTKFTEAGPLSGDWRAIAENCCYLRAARALYTRDRFNDHYQWTPGWGLVPPGAIYENVVDNHSWR